MFLLMTFFYFIKNGSLYNYADDNTLAYWHKDFDTLINTLQDEISVLLKWFKENCMQANPSKFQAVALGKKTFDKNPVFKIDGAEILCNETVKLL